jgi:hypothetical protein
MIVKHWVMGLVLGLLVLGILGLVWREGFGGPTFRAQDHGSYEECLRNIPGEWLPGMLERTRAETACLYAHSPQQPPL